MYRMNNQDLVGSFKLVKAISQTGLEYVSINKHVSVTAKTWKAKKIMVCDESLAES